MIRAEWKALFCQSLNSIVSLSTFEYTELHGSNGEQFILFNLKFIWKQFNSRRFDGAVLLPRVQIYIKNFIQNYDNCYNFSRIIVIFAKTAQHSHDSNCNRSNDRLEANTMEVSFTPIIYKSPLMHIVQWDEIKIIDYYSNKNDPNS